MLYAGVLLFLLLQFLRPQEFLPFLYAQPVVYYSMLLLLPFWVFTLPGKKFLRTPEDVFMFTFYILVVLSDWRSPGRMYETAVDFAKPFLSYFFVAHVIDTRRRLAGAVFWVMLMLLILALLAGPVNVGTPHEQYASVGQFAVRNVFCDAMVLVIPMALVFLLLGNVFLKVCGLGMLLVVVPELVKSGGRGAMLAAMASVSALFIFMTKRKGAKIALAVAGVLAVVIAVSVSGRLGTITTYRQDPSAMSRIATWTHAIELFHGRPMGRGYNSFIYHSRTGMAAHSSYLKILMEIGAQGLFVYIGLLFFATRDAYVAYKNARHPTTRMLALGLSAMLLGHCVSALTATYSYYIYIIVLVAIASALRAIAQREIAESSETTTEVVPGAAMPLAAGMASSTGGFAFAEKRLVTKRDLKVIGTLTFGCWLMYLAIVTFA